MPNGAHCCSSKDVVVRPQLQIAFEVLPPADLMMMARTSTFAGRRGMLEALGEPDVRFVVGRALLRGGPVRMEEQRMSPQLIREPQSLRRGERPPVGLLRGPDRCPVAFTFRLLHAWES